jgi:ADP-ribosylglycohydrolase
MSSITNDRAAGAVLGFACGDALGAGIEATPPLELRGSPGEWSGRTAMAVPVLRGAAAGESLAAESAQNGIVASWVAWSQTAKDAGSPHTAVFEGLREPTAAAARAAARSAPARSAGATALLLAAPIALPFVQTASTTGLVRTARQLSALTSVDALSGEACVLWAGAIHHAIRTGELDLRGRIALLPEDRRGFWSAAIDEAEGTPPNGLEQDGGGVRALQGAWSAIVRTAVPDAQPGGHLRLVLEAGVRGAGGVAVTAIAGGLLGAAWGASAVPAAWRRILHGEPGLAADDLVRFAVLAANGGLGDGTGWPAVDRVRPFGQRVLVPHPHDDGVLLGSLAALDDLPEDIDAVVSLCRVGRRQTDREQVGFWLVDQPGRNPNLDLVLRDAANTVAVLRAEGKRVLLHCAEGRSRTPSVGSLYAAMHLGVPVARALAEVTAALPEGAPAPFLQEAVLRIGGEVAGAARRKRVLYVDLDTAMLDVRSGVERLPAAARAVYRGRYDEAPGIVGLMDPVPGAVAAFARLAEVYDAALVTSAPWGSPSAWQHRLDWVQLHFGTEEVDAVGIPNPAHRRLILGHAHLPSGAILIDAQPDAGLEGADRPDGADRPEGADRFEGFEGERIRLGDGPFPHWEAVLQHLLAPERLGLDRPGGMLRRSRDRIAGRPSLTAWLLGSLRARGGAASLVQVSRDIWQQHEEELRRSGDLFYTWQHDLRRVAARLRDEGRLAPSSDGDQGVWRLAR